MEIKGIINIVAIVLSPIIAVVVTIFLQNRSDKKKEKIAIIKSLLSTGHYLYSDEISQLQSNQCKISCGRMLV